LPLVPAVFSRELVEHPLNLHREVGRRIHALAHGGSIAVPGPDDVADSIFMAVDRELVCRGKAAALIAELRQCLFIHRTGTTRRSARRGRDRQPPAAVRIGVRVPRIDQVVPKCVENLEQAVFPMIRTIGLIL
jgi:hypothetical protein